MDAAMIGCLRRCGNAVVRVRAMHGVRKLGSARQLG
jgi:hypothetical protein